MAAAAAFDYVPARPNRRFSRFGRYCGEAAGRAGERRQGVQHNGHKVIVVVEDDPGMRSSLEFLLESHGFDVAAFASPEDMLKGLDSLDSGCAIFDVHLPGKDGIELYEGMRARGDTLPAIFITGQIDDQIRANARRLKAIALLEKPFSDEALLDAVGRALAVPAST
jgi:FixJ family two-component response regulator